MEKIDLIKKITDKVIEKLNTNNLDKADRDRKIVTGVSVRHVHLTKKHIEELFGNGYSLSPLKELSQPGQYAAKEVVTLVGGKLTALQNIRVLGPPREETQVELSKTDCIALGIDAPTRLSGNTKGSAPIVIVGPNGSVNLPEGAIRAERHIHMSLQDADFFNLSDKSYVDVRVSGPRGLTFNNVVVRISPDYKTEFHVDTDDANTCDLINGSMVEIVDASCIVPIAEKTLEIADGEVIPPTIPDNSGYISVNNIKTSTDIISKNFNSSNTEKKEILTISDIVELAGKGVKINTDIYALTPLAIDYLKEKNIKTE